MPAYPSLSTQVIGQAESALGAILRPLLARTGITFHQWLVLTLTAASGPVIDRGQLIARITSARKVDDAEAGTAISSLGSAGLLEVLPGDPPRVSLTRAGRDRYDEIRTALEDVTARVFCDLPAEDLATAGRVLSVVTERANAELGARI